MSPVTRLCLFPFEASYQLCSVAHKMGDMVKSILGRAPWCGMTFPGSLVQLGPPLVSDSVAVLGDMTVSVGPGRAWPGLSWEASQATSLWVSQAFSVLSPREH